MSAYSHNIRLPRSLPNLSDNTHQPTKREVKLLCSLKSPNFPSVQLRLLSVTNRRCRRLVLAGCAKSDFASKKDVLIEESRVFEIDTELRIDGGGGGDDDKNVRGGGGGDGGEGGGDGEEEEFGPIMKYADVMRETEARGAKLPADMLEAAKTTGLPKVILERYLELQVHLIAYSVALKFWFCANCLFKKQIGSVKNRLTKLLGKNLLIYCLPKNLKIDQFGLFYCNDLKFSHILVSYLRRRIEQRPVK